MLSIVGFIVVPFSLSTSPNLLTDSLSLTLCMYVHFHMKKGISRKNMRKTTCDANIGNIYNTYMHFCVMIPSLIPHSLSTGVVYNSPSNFL